MNEKVKQEKQKKRQKHLFKILPKDYYHKLELVSILGLTHASIDTLTNKLEWYPGKGYSKLDIVLKLTGGQLISN